MGGRRARTVAAVSLAWPVVWLMGLAGCGERSSVRYADGLGGGAAGSIAPEPVDSVEVFDAEPGRAFRTIARVTASADARYEANIPEAEVRARRELRKAAAEAGAHGVVIETREVGELEAAWDATPLTPDFEGDSRDLLSPGRPGAVAGKRAWRVRLIGRAVVFEQ